MIKWFLKLTTAKKVYVIIGLIVFLVILYLSIKVAWYKYKYVKALEKEVIELRETVKTYDEAETKLLEDAKTETKTVQKKSKSIDDKLKQDEKTIDASTVTHDDIDEFLARYENR